MNHRLCTALVLSLCAAGAHAAAPPEQVARLGRDLTETGAERAGNPAGTIPAYLGRAAFDEAQIRFTRAQLEDMRTRLVKDIEQLVGDARVVSDVLAFGQDIMDSDPARFAKVLQITRAMLTQDAALKADIDKLLASRGGKSIEALLQQVEQKQLRLVDLTPDIVAVTQGLKSQGAPAFSRMVAAFDASKALELAGLVEQPVKGRSGADLLISYMPPYVRDFMAFKVPGKKPEDLLKPLYIVTGANLAEHADVLSEGHKALFKTYPDYKMVVFPSVRAAFFPDEVNRATVANATRASMSGTDTVVGAELGFPFPIPQTGAEPLWNHKLKFRGSAVRRYNNQAIVNPDGTFKISKLIEDIKFTYANLKTPGKTAAGEPFLFFLQEVLSPPRVAGQITLVQEISGGGGGRNAWLFSPGLGRVNRAPDIGYDNPAIGSDGEQFYDQIDVFNGSLDRYDWKLIGKKDVLIPYNSYIVNSPTFKYRDLLRPGHINQDLARYELHRVWVVEANLKSGQRHRFSKRTYYLDEDSWSIAIVDCYDARGQLWKVQEAHLISLPFIPTTTAIPELIYDLQSKRYFATTMTNEDAITDWEIDYENSMFLPAALQKKARTK